MTTTSKEPTVVTQADWIAGPEQGKWTYDSYAALLDDEQRYEIIDGVLFTMPPAPTPPHQQVIGRIFRYFATYIEDTGLGRVFFAPLDVVLAPKTVVQPDVFILLKTGSAKITDKRIQGVPDLVVEVSSPGTVGHDRSVKQKAYEKAGVREYWFVDPLAYTIEILILEGKTYKPLGVYSGEQTLPSLIVPALEEVAVEKLFV